MKISKRKSPVFSPLTRHLHQPDIDLYLYRVNLPVHVPGGDKLSALSPFKQMQSAFNA